MLAPFMSEGRVTVLPRHQPVSADVSRDFVRAVTLRTISILAISKPSRRLIFWVPVNTACCNSMSEPMRAAS